MFLFRASGSGCHRAAQPSYVKPNFHRFLSPTTLLTQSKGTQLYLAQTFKKQYDRFFSTNWKWTEKPASVERTFQKSAPPLSIISPISSSSSFLFRFKSRGVMLKPANLYTWSKFTKIEYVSAGTFLFSMLVAVIAFVGLLWFFGAAAILTVIFLVVSFPIFLIAFTLSNFTSFLDRKTVERAINNDDTLVSALGRPITVDWNHMSYEVTKAGNERIVRVRAVVRGQNGRKGVAAAAIKQNGWLSPRECLFLEVALDDGSLIVAKSNDNYNQIAF